MDLLKRMRDGQAWETIKARRKEAEQERETDLLEPLDEEIQGEVKQKEAAEPDDEEVIADSNIMEDPAQAEVIITGTLELNIDTNTEFNIKVDQETEELVNSESVTHSLWPRLSGYFRWQGLIFTEFNETLLYKTYKTFKE